MTSSSFPLPTLSLPSSSLRLDGGQLEVEPDYEKYLSEETAKLQRLYGGGDLSSFPEFTFTGETEMDREASLYMTCNIIYSTVLTAGSGIKYLFHSPQRYSRQFLYNVFRLELTQAAKTR